MAVSHDYESGDSLATLGYTAITDLSNQSGEGLGGSTWGARGSGTASQRANARATVPTANGAGRLFYIAGDFDHIDFLETNREAFALKSSTIGGNNTFLGLLDDIDSDGHFEIYVNAVSAWSSAAGIVPASGVTRRYELCGEMSSTNVTSDGWVRFSLNGVEQVTLTGLLLWGNNISGGDFAEATIAPKGRFDNLVITALGCPSQQIRAAAICLGGQVTVEADRAMAINLDGGTNVHNTPGELRVFGDVEVTGDLTTEGTLSVEMSDALDALGT